MATPGGKFSQSVASQSIRVTQTPCLGALQALRQVIQQGKIEDNTADGVLSCRDCPPPAADCPPKSSIWVAGAHIQVYHQRLGLPVLDFSEFGRLIKSAALGCAIY